MVAPLFAAGARAVAAKTAKKKTGGVSNVAVHKKVANINRAPRPRLVSNNSAPEYANPRKDNVGGDDYRGVRPHTPDDAAAYDEQLRSSEQYNQQRISNVRQYRKSLATTQQRIQGRLMNKVGAGMNKLGFSAGKKSVVQKIRVLKAVRTVFYICCVLYLVQLFGWAISLMGLALENAADFFSLSGLASLVSDTLADGIKVGEDTFEDVTGIELSLAQLIPGITIFLIGYIIVLVAGVATMLITAAVFMIYRVKAFDTWGKTLAFTVALAGYMTPIPLVNGLPFGLLWVWAVFFNAKRGE